MLDEQFKAKALPEKEYKKTKQINMNRLSDIDKKIAAIQSGESPAPSPEQWAEGAKSAPEAQAGKPPKEPSADTVTGSSPGKEPPTKTEQDEPKPEEKKPEEKKPEEKQPKEDGAPADENKGTQITPQQEMLSELEDSLMNGLISREAYDKTKKLIGENDSRENPPKDDKKSDKK